MMRIVTDDGVGLGVEELGAGVAVDGFLHRTSGHEPGYPARSE